MGEATAAFAPLPVVLGSLGKRGRSCQGCSNQCVPNPLSRGRVFVGAPSRAASGTVRWALRRASLQ